MKAKIQARAPMMILLLKVIRLLLGLLCPNRHLLHRNRTLGLMVEALVLRQPVALTLTRPVAVPRTAAVTPVMGLLHQNGNQNTERHETLIFGLVHSGFSV